MREAHSCALLVAVFIVLLLCMDVERMEKEAEEERIRKQRAAVERVFHEGVTKAKLVMRRVPLGTDRNHNRYTHVPCFKKYSAKRNPTYRHGVRW